MPAVVTFDPTNHPPLIVEIDTGGDNELDVAKVYSDWKNWLLADPSRLGYSKAFSQVGGDPITPTQNLGSTFFLENGWRFRPAERNHKLTLVGNIFTREPGESVFVPTVGAFTVNTETRVSNLVDSSVARLDLDQLLQGVYIDTVNGVAGTGDTVGTPTNPVNNLPDAYAIATSKNLEAFFVRGPIVLDRDLLKWRFEGISSRFADSVDINGFDVGDAVFESMAVSGAMQGRIECVGCRLAIITAIDGIFSDCGLADPMTLANACDAVFANCYADTAGAPPPKLIFGVNSEVQIRNFSGGIEFENMTTGCVASVDLDPGRLIMGPTNTGGQLIRRGVGSVQDTSSGVTIVIDDIVSPTTVRDKLFESTLPIAPVPYSVAETLMVLRGMAAKSTVLIDNHIYDANGFLLSARVRVFPTEALTAAATPGATVPEGEIYTTTISGVPDGVYSTKPASVRGVRQ